MDVGLPVTEATCVGSEEIAALLVTPVAPIVPLVLLVAMVLAGALEPKGPEAPWDCKAAKRFCMNAVTL